MAHSTRTPLLRLRVLAVTAAAVAMLLAVLVGGSDVLGGVGPSADGDAGNLSAGTGLAAVPEPPIGTATTGGLTPGTRRAYRAAERAMAAEGIGMTLTSGYRSWAEQEQLYEQALSKYGSAQAARVWVLPPEESRHVRGVAVDVAPKAAARWLDRHGARYGLCRTMEWEWWHFEYDPDWQRAGHCPQPRRRG